MAPVDFGLLLSGEKLVDNHDYREQLKRLAPEATGGEMEGAGLYVARQDAKVDWIVIKAICDRADGHKKRNRPASNWPRATPRSWRTLYSEPPETTGATDGTTSLNDQNTGSGAVPPEAAWPPERAAWRWAET